MPGLTRPSAWREQTPGRKFDYRMPPTLHEAILASAHRTTRPDEADLFYVRARGSYRAQIGTALRAQTITAFSAHRPLRPRGTVG